MIAEAANDVDPKYS